MKCLLCNLSFSIGDNLRNHYIWQHLVNENDVYSKDLFTPDTNYKGYDVCMVDFNKLKEQEKPHVFI